MGLDAEIYFECSDDEEPSDVYLPDGFSIQPFKDRVQYISNGVRYYGINYERGPWPKLCAVLMSLFASGNVTKVWYQSDSAEFRYEYPIDVDYVLEISRHYMLNGDRPYRDYFK